MINKNRRLWQTWTLTEERSCGGCRLVRSGGGLEGGGLRSVCGEGGGSRSGGPASDDEAETVRVYTGIYAQ